MDYEKKYKNALGWMQGMYNGLHGKTKEEAEKFFPELAESEDEKIRKELINIINLSYNCGIAITKENYKKYIAWLIKQESVGEIIERCKTSWYNEGKIAGMAEGLTDDEKYQQGWHDAFEKACEYLENKLPQAMVRSDYYMFNGGFIKDFKKAMEK